MTTNTESYEMKQVMRRVAACLTAPMHELGGRSLWLPSAWTEDNIPRLVDDSRWRTTLGDKSFLIVLKDPDGKPLWDRHDHRHNEFVMFSNPRYSGDSHKEKGILQQVEDIEVNADEKSKVFTNYTDDPINIAYEESLVLTDSHEKSTNEEWHFDVSETVEIGGEAYGVSASSSTTVDAGESGGESETDSSSEENATGVSINFELQSGEVVRVNTYFHESRTRQDYDTHAILDFDIEMHFNHWPSSDHKAAIRRNKQVVKVSGVAGLMDYFKNRDANQPLTHDVEWVSRVKNCLNRIFFPGARTYHITGTEERSIQDNEDFKLEKLSHDAIPPDVEIIDMSDKDNFEKYSV